MNGGGGGGGGGSPEPAYSEAKTSVWWDIENCMVPHGTDPNLIAQNISTALARAGYTGPISITAYGDTGLLLRTIQHALSSTGINLHHVPAGIKDASDKKILVDMLFWAIDNPPPANYLLISGDRDFCNALHKLRMSRYNILLAHAPSVSQTLVAAAKSVWLWKSLADGDPPSKDNSYVSSVDKNFAIAKLREEEEARKREEEEERKKKEEAERKAKLDAIAEKQGERERELEERARLEKERLLRPPVDPVHPAPAQPLPPAPAPAPAPGPAKYAPKFKRGGGDRQVEPPQRPDEAGERSSRPDVSSVVKDGEDAEVARALETVQSAPPTLEGLKVTEQKGMRDKKVKLVWKSTGGKSESSSSGASQDGNGGESGNGGNVESLGSEKSLDLKDGDDKVKDTSSTKKPVVKPNGSSQAEPTLNKSGSGSSQNSQAHNSKNCIKSQKSSDAVPNNDSKMRFNKQNHQQNTSNGPRAYRPNLHEKYNSSNMHKANSYPQMHYVQVSNDLNPSNPHNYPYAPQPTMPAPHSFNPSSSHSKPHSFNPSNSHHAKPYQLQTNMQPTMNNFNPSNSYNNSYMQQNNIPSAQNFGQPNNHNIPAQNFGQPNNHNIPSAQNFGQPNNHNIPAQNFGQPNGHNIPTQNFGRPNNHNTHYGTNPNWPDGPSYPSGNFCTEPGSYPPNPNHPYPPQNLPPQYYDYNYRPVQTQPPPSPPVPVRNYKPVRPVPPVPTQPVQTPRYTAGTGTVPNQPKPEQTPRSTTGTGTVPNQPKPAQTPRNTTGTGTVPNQPKPAQGPRSTTGTGMVPNQPQPLQTPRNTTGTGTGTVPNQPKLEVQILISVVLRVLSILKKEKIASNEANIENCVRFGEINMPTFNAKSALEAAVEQNVVMKFELESKGKINNTFYVPKNEGMWNCVNVMDLDVKISRKTLNELIRFLSSSRGRDELTASQCSYHAAVILKKSSLKTRTLGDVLQILNNLISVKKWIVPNSSSGWQPLSLILNGSDPNPNPNPIPNPDPAVKPNSDQPTFSACTGWDEPTFSACTGWDD